jgi:hypothetical protein
VKPTSLEELAHRNSANTSENGITRDLCPPGEGEGKSVSRRVMNEAVFEAGWDIAAFVCDYGSDV